MEILIAYLRKIIEFIISLLESIGDIVLFNKKDKRVKWHSFFDVKDSELLASLLESSVINKGLSVTNNGCSIMTYDNNGKEYCKMDIPLKKHIADKIRRK